MTQKTLVVILSQTRAHELTFDSFKQNVIDELDADLCVCIGVKNDYDYGNPYYTLAKYRFLYNEEDDPGFVKSVKYSYEKTIKERVDTANFKIVNNAMYERYDNINYVTDQIDPDNSHKKLTYLGRFDFEDDIKFPSLPNINSFVYYKNDSSGEFAYQLYAVKQADGNLATDDQTTTFVRHKHYSAFLKFKNKISTENDDHTSFTDFTISTYIHIFFLWFLQQNIRRHDLLSKYDRFVILRSDYFYALPFPKMSLLQDEYIWIPFGEDYGGICDRAVVLSKSNFTNYVCILEGAYNWSNAYYRLIEKLPTTELNMEQILQWHLVLANAHRSIRRYPNISYAVRGKNDATRWSTGTYKAELGYYIKYPNEYAHACLVKNAHEESRLPIDDFYHLNTPITRKSIQEALRENGINARDNGGMIKGQD